MFCLKVKILAFFKSLEDAAAPTKELPVYFIQATLKTLVSSVLFLSMLTRIIKKRKNTCKNIGEHIFKNLLASQKKLLEHKKNPVM